MSCRLYVDQSLHTATTFALPPDQSHYLRQVMRLQAGDELILFNGMGGEFHATISQLSRQECICSVGEFIDVDREMTCRIHIIQAACRNEKIDTVLQKGTELGAVSFHIVRSERSSLKLDENKLVKRLDRWQKIIIEAAEQSGRTALPQVFWHQDLSGIKAEGLAFSLHPEAVNNFGLHLAELISAKDISLAIGPEGGWSPRDLATLNAKGFQQLVFGQRILRTETAAPALLAAIQALRGNG